MVGGGCSYTEPGEGTVERIVGTIAVCHVRLCAANLSEGSRHSDGARLRKAVGDRIVFDVGPQLHLQHSFLQLHLLFPKALRFQSTQIRGASRVSVLGVMIVASGIYLIWVLLTLKASGFPCMPARWAGCILQCISLKLSWCQVKDSRAIVVISFGILFLFLL